MILGIEEIPLCRTIIPLGIINILYGIEPLPKRIFMILRCCKGIPRCLRMISVGTIDIIDKIALLPFGISMILYCFKLILRRMHKIP